MTDQEKLDELKKKINTFEWSLEMDNWDYRFTAKLDEDDNVGIYYGGKPANPRPVHHAELNKLLFTYKKLKRKIEGGTSEPMEELKEGGTNER